MTLKKQLQAANIDYIAKRKQLAVIQSQKGNRIIDQLARLSIEAANNGQYSVEKQLSIDDLYTLIYNGSFKNFNSNFTDISYNTVFNTITLTWYAGDDRLIIQDIIDANK